MHGQQEGGGGELALKGVCTGHGGDRGVAGLRYLHGRTVTGVWQDCDRGMGVTGCRCDRGVGRCDRGVGGCDRGSDGRGKGVADAHV